jgi:hypothetical protein
MRKAISLAIVSLGAAHAFASGGELPVNPDVTPENIESTICVRGYSASIRPPQAYTDRVKRHLMREAGLPLDTIGDYILDHRINIAIGGSPTSLQNLQLQRHDLSLEKDRAENRAHSLVCTHRLSLREAQAIMFTDWRRLLPTR